MAELLEDFLNVNVRKIKKCPRCGAKHYERRLENTSVTRMNNGIQENHFITSGDAGSTWHCLECKLHIYQDGSWEEREIH